MSGSDEGERGRDPLHAIAVRCLCELAADCAIDVDRFARNLFGRSPSELTRCELADTIDALKLRVALLHPKDRARNRASIRERERDPRDE